MPRRHRAAPAALLLLFLLLLLALLLPPVLGGSPAARCPVPCRCAGHLVACSRLELGRVPERLPRGAVQLDLSHNKLSSIKTSFLDHLHSLREVKLNNNELEMIPNLGPVSANITLLSLPRSAKSAGAAAVSGLLCLNKN